ncbi:hypothetical protein DFH07DRAFT_1014373 [Mycena maculata]|uniref:FAD/NAD(P)-binding domain-containing protein n=1 Tax=Mycena maculata TaxID=230809 RepID=A0AAD7NM20_9AGAR|nr:hypothetical protein DFH07DRAFT_1014373 [Mycena maculata]
MMYDVAVGQGAKIRLGTTAVAVDPERRVVALESGETLTADVIVGADGVSGLVRPLLLAEQIFRKFQIHPCGGPCIYGVTFTFCLYRPCDDFADRPVDGMRAALQEAEPRLKSLGPLMYPPRRFPVLEYPALENWWRSTPYSGTLDFFLFNGAHSNPFCVKVDSTQYYAMGVEDGAVLAKLFSHLHTHDQITEFLHAFQELHPRCENEVRDEAMMAKTATGANLFKVSDGEDEAPEWAEIKDVFGYDAEDEADNWWRQRSLARSVSVKPTEIRVARN